MCWHLQLVVLVVTLLHFSLAPALSQTCLKEYTNLEEESPTQRVGTVRSDRDLSLLWSKPTDFTEIHDFAGKAYQLADHEGIDFIHSDRAISEVSVRSAADGKVVYIRRGCPQFPIFTPNTEQRGCGGDWGNHVVILHPNGLFTRYAHLAPNSIQVRVGQQVHRGEAIAKMGNSGRSNTRHLHFELGVAIHLKSCEPAQSFQYVYSPATYCGWLDLR